MKHIKLENTFTSFEALLGFLFYAFFIIMGIASCALVWYRLDVVMKQFGL